MQINNKQTDTSLKESRRILEEISANILNVPKQECTKLKKAAYEKQVSDDLTFCWDSSVSEFDKLLEITSKCVDYYNKFVEEKNLRLQILNQAFGQIHFRLEHAFEQIIQRIRLKQLDLHSFLNKKHEELMREKDDEEKMLKTELDSIKSVHLTNLLRDQHQETGVKECQFQLSSELSNFASTLNKFYTVMSKIEQNTFQDNTNQCVGFINNLIREQIRIAIDEHYQQRMEEILDFSFSYSRKKGEDTFCVAEEPNATEVALHRQMERIAERQRERRVRRVVQ